MYQLNREGEGLYCSDIGLKYGSLALVAKSRITGRFEPCGFDGFLKADFASRRGSLKAVANALNEGNIVCAQIAALHLRMPPLTPRIARKLAKDNFDPDEPRDDHGRWTDESGGDDDTAPPQQSAHEDEPVGTGLRPGVNLASYPPEYGQDTLPAESGTIAYSVAPGINSIDDANAIVEGMDGQYIGRNANCASLTRALVPTLPPTSQWQRGDLVEGDTDIPIGTAIATFNFYGNAGTNGYGPSDHPEGASGVSHTGIYLGQDASGITILNQWVSRGYPVISHIPWSAWGTNSNEGGSRYYSINR